MVQYFHSLYLLLIEKSKICSLNENIFLGKTSTKENLVQSI